MTRIEEIKERDRKGLLPAFPSEDPDNFYYGMTLRDYFAAKAMVGTLANPIKVGDSKEIAKWSYRVADAMLNARNNA